MQPRTALRRLRGPAGRRAGNSSFCPSKSIFKQPVVLPHPLPHLELLFRHGGSHRQAAHQALIHLRTAGGRLAQLNNCAAVARAYCAAPLSTERVQRSPMCCSSSSLIQGRRLRRQAGTERPTDHRLSHGCDAGSLSGTQHCQVHTAHLPLAAGQVGHHLVREAALLVHAAAGSGGMQVTVAGHGDTQHS